MNIIADLLRPQLSVGYTRQVLPITRPDLPRRLPLTTGHGE